MTIKVRFFGGIFKHSAFGTATSSMIMGILVGPIIKNGLVFKVVNMWRCGHIRLGMENNRSGVIEQHETIESFYVLVKVFFGFIRPEFREIAIRI